MLKTFEQLQAFIKNLGGSDEGNHLILETNSGKTYAQIYEITRHEDAWNISVTEYSEYVFEETHGTIEELSTQLIRMISYPINDFQKLQHLLENNHRIMSTVVPEDHLYGTVKNYTLADEDPRWTVYEMDDSDDLLLEIKTDYSHFKFFGKSIYEIERTLVSFIKAYTTTP